ncbi:MAG TPA: xanthine dehydrogenase family protein molybdopterin-binding subunit, partial [Silvibacterium sp.]|nr:xanthine dehydrogenase family protein molybdopterin-binding subunit [Silvibacterium sp.]
MATHPSQDAPPQTAGSPDKKTVMMPVGVPGYTLKDEAREVPVTEPPVWPINKDLKYVGHSVERWDGQAKVSGRARYTADIQLPGMLYAKFVSASVPHAKVVSIDTSAAERYPGVKGVYVVQHVLGGAVLRDPALEQATYPVVRYAGQPVAAVAAVTPYAAEEAAALVKVNYEPRPFVVELDKARATNAPLVFPGAADQAGTAGGGGGPH